MIETPQSTAPEKLRLHISLALNAKELGNFIKAAHHLEDALEVAPNIENIYIELCELYELLGLFPNAIKTVHQYINHIGSTNAYNTAAWLYLRGYQDEAKAKGLIAQIPDADNISAKVRTLLAIYHGDWNQALNHCIQALGLPLSPTPPTPFETILAPKKKTSFSKAPSLSIATSLSPKGGNAQHQAMQTWRNSVDQIISVNTRDEINTLQTDYPFITFFEAKRNGQEHIGKPLIYINDILESLRNTTSDLCGIVNGDILLLNEDTLKDALTVAGTDSLTVCHRIEMDNFNASQGHLYTKGFDAFFFPPNRIPNFQLSNFCLGSPWWDYLFPILAWYANMTVNIPSSINIGHVSHGENWSNEMQLMGASAWIDAILQLRPNNSTAAASISQFCIPLARHMRNFLDTPACDSTPAMNKHRALETTTLLGTLVMLYIRNQAR